MIWVKVNYLAICCMFSRFKQYAMEFYGQILWHRIQKATTWTRICEVPIQPQHSQLGLASVHCQRGSLTRILYAVVSSSYPHVRHIVAFSVLLSNRWPLETFVSLNILRWLVLSHIRKPSNFVLGVRDCLPSIHHLRKRPDVVTGST